MAEKKEEKKTSAKKETTKAAKKKEPKKTSVKKETTKAKETAEPKAKATKKAADKNAKESVKAAEEVKTEVKEEVKEEALHPTLQKKKERREAKAARKAANAFEDKKSRPNNILLAILIFGLLIAMFAFVGSYNYFQKPASIEKYIEETGGAEVYENVQIDTYTVANITAEGNSVKIDMTAEVEDAIKELKEYYGGDEGKERLEEIAASVLSNTKSNTRGFSADAKIKMSINGEEINSLSMSYSEAKKKIKELEEEYGTTSGDELEIDTEDLEIDSEDIEIVTDEEEHIHEEETEGE